MEWIIISFECSPLHISCLIYAGTGLRRAFQNNPIAAGNILSLA